MPSSRPSVEAIPLATTLQRQQPVQQGFVLAQLGGDTGVADHALFEDIDPIGQSQPEVDAPLAQHRKQLANRFDRLSAGAAGGAVADLEVLPHDQLGEDAAIFWGSGHPLLSSGVAPLLPPARDAAQWFGGKHGPHDGRVQKPIAET